ncbi:MAG: GMC family oxidoreductase [Acidobacteria bacterium]|nr:GMC family oxidoreductase [Acidobacteriota bacterium]
MPQPPPPADVVIVGAGATGGWAAKRLAEAGLRVVVLDAGRPTGPEDYREHTPAYALPLRTRSKAQMARTRPQQSQSYACTEWNQDWFCSDLDEPYTTPVGKPFPWVGRVRLVGGRTHVWGRQSYRYSDLDFRSASRDGFGIDWPLTAADLAPWYDLVEQYVGITGVNVGIPQLPDQHLQPPMGLSCVETHVREVSRTRHGRTMTQARTANLTQAINGRQACHYCGPCERGCMTHSYFNAAYTTLPDALKTGRCTLIPQAMAWQVLVDPTSRRATGIRYIDRQSRAVREVTGRVVMLGAQAFESVRILLNSASAQDPAGLANSSGVLGKYLLSHFTGFGATAEFPAFDVPANANVPRRPTGLFVARFRNLDGQRPDPRFPRGYGYQGGGSTNFETGVPGLGPDYVSAVRTSGRTVVNLGGFGEPLPDARNRVTIDPDVVDAWGIPVVRIEMAYSDTDRAMMRDGAESAAEMLADAGGTSIRINLSPRWASHEAGIARMGADPATSVVNQFQQTHDIRNLFVVDGASMPSVGYVNPTLTMMALVVRSCDYLLDALRTGKI